MKRLLAGLLAVILLTALTLPMTSCSQSKKLLRMEEPERAVAFYTVTDRNMNYARSGSFEQTMVMDATMNGVAYKQTTEATVTFISDRDDVTYLEQAKTEVDVVGGGTVIYSDSGYADGMMFSYIKEGKNETKLKSAVTLNEYSTLRQFQNESAPLIRVGEGFCETMTCRQAEDGTWTATYEGFTEEGMIPFMYMLRGVDYMITAEHSIADVRMTMTADEKLYPISMTMEFVFEKNPASTSPLPVVTMENKYQGWNNTVLAEPYDLSDFTEVDDLRAVEVFTDALLERSTADSGAFHVDVTTTAKGGGYDNTAVNGQKITFNSADGFRFTYEYDKDGYDYKINYADGDMTVKIYENGKKVHSEVQDMTDAEARGTVVQLMDPEQINARGISDVEIIDAEQGICRFTLSDAFRKSYEEQYEMSGMTMTDFSGYCEATLPAGELTAYRYHMEITLKVEGQSVKTVVDMVITFTETQLGGETV